MSACLWFLGYRHPFCVIFILIAMDCWFSRMCHCCRLLAEPHLSGWLICAGARTVTPWSCDISRGMNSACVCALNDQVMGVKAAFAPAHYIHKDSCVWLGELALCVTVKGLCVFRGGWGLLDNLLAAAADSGGLRAVQWWSYVMCGMSQLKEAYSMWNCAVQTATGYSLSNRAGCPDKTLACYCCSNSILVRSKTFVVFKQVWEKHCSFSKYACLSNTDCMIFILWSLFGMVITLKSLCSLQCKMDVMQLTSR